MTEPIGNLLNSLGIDLDLMARLACSMPIETDNLGCGHGD